MWWRIDELELRPVEFDFQSSGQGTHHGRSLCARGTSLVNDVDLADLTTSSCQVVVCDACGTIGCSSGNWVVMRRLGSAVVWVPDFRRMMDGEFERSQSAPPEYVRRKGAPLFGDAVLARLQSLLPTLPVEHLPRLSVWEAALLLQWIAPGDVLGRFPDPLRVRKDVILATDSGETSSRCAELDSLLANASPETPAELSPPGITPIRFYIDLPGTPEWEPLAKSPEGRLMLNLGVRVDELGSA